MNLDIVVKDPILEGPLTLFPLFSSAPSAPPYLTGPEAEARQALQVTERPGAATVPELVVHNRGEVPVLLLEGETILGAKQHRTLNVSVLVPARATLEVPVTCVEHGRWGQARMTARSRRHLPADIRRRNSIDVMRARRAGAGPRTDQRAVWDRVALYQSDLAAPSDTSALEDVFDAVDDPVRRAVGHVPPHPDQRGVAVAMGGKVVGIDWFDAASTLASYWASLLAGYAIDGLRAPDQAATIVDAERFVADVTGAALTPETTVGLGTDHSLAGARVTGHALEWEGAVVHLAAFSSPNGHGLPERTQPIDRRRWFGKS